MRILLIEDDPVIGNNIRLILTRTGYAVDMAVTAGDGYRKAIDENYDVLIIDWMLPDEDGITVIKRLRSEEVGIPILILTAKNQTADKVSGLDTGADDFLTKPFSGEELLARIRTLLRRKDKPLTAPVITVADLIIDTNVRSVTRSGKKILLSPKEYSLLEYLAYHQCTPVDRVTLLSHAWDEQVDLFSNTVDVHIRYLRKKIDDRCKRKLIQTVKGKGYMVCGNSV